MNKPHDGLTIVKVRGYKNGAIIADYRCHACGTVWENVWLKSLSHRSNSICDECQRLMNAADKAVLDRDAHYSYRSKHTGNSGGYGLRDDLAYYWQSGVPLSYYAKNILKKLGVNPEKKPLGRKR